MTTTADTTIAHTLPTGETIDFLVEVDLDRPTGAAVFISYTGDLSLFSGARAYPIAEIEAFVSRVAGRPLRAGECFFWGGRGDGCEEGWLVESAE